MPSVRKVALANILPVDQPNAGEKLVVHSFARDGSGRYSWHYAPLSKKQIARNAVNPPGDSCVEIRIKNFDVSQLAAVFNNLPKKTSVRTGLCLIIELDENFAASTERAIEFSRTVGVPESKEYLDKYGFRVPRGEPPLISDREASVMRTAIISAVEIEYNDRKVDGQRLLQFWDDIGDVRRGQWDLAERERFVHLLWAIRCRVETMTPRVPKLAWWAVGAAAVVVVAGVLSVV